MQTRAAAKKLADAVAAVSTAAGTSVEQADDEQRAAIADGAGLIEDLRSASKITSGTTKRKRAGKKQARPLKGGWALPHGMGVGVVGPDASSPRAVEATLPASSLVDSQPEAEESKRSGPSATSQVNTKKIVVRHTRQTRLFLRVTKAEVEGQKNNQTEQEPAVKLKEPAGASIKQEDERPRKRARTGLVATKDSSDATASDEGVPNLAAVKAGEKSTPNEAIPKVLIFKGVAINDNVVTKVSSKIIVDATQLLDPSFKRMVKRGKENPYGLTPGFSPYPYRRVPTPEACEEVHRILTELHGEVKQPEKMPVASLDIAGCGEVPCVLDALLRTLISGNTLMALADSAIKSLAQHYGLRQEGTGAGSINWDKARLSSHQELAEVIKVAGNGPKRSQHIKQILDMVYEENVERAKVQSSTATATHLLSLDHMHGMTKDEAMAKFVAYPGIGIKTAACVTLFCLRMPCFAVDTHVHKFCRWLGWVPEKADPDNCFRHGDFMVPDPLKYGLHQLFIRHGQLCFKCRKATKPGTKDWNEAPDCPLEHLLDRSKDEAGIKAKSPKQVEEESGSGAGKSGSEVDADDEEH